MLISVILRIYLDHHGPSASHDFSADHFKSNAIVFWFLPFQRRTVSVVQFHCVFLRLLSSTSAAKQPVGRLLTKGVMDDVRTVMLIENSAGSGRQRVVGLASWEARILLDVVDAIDWTSLIGVELPTVCSATASWRRFVATELNDL